MKGKLAIGFLWNMARDLRYKAVKRLVEKGDIKYFNEIFDYIPKSTVAADLGKQNVRFTQLMNHIERFTLKDLFMLAKFFDVEDQIIFDLAYNQYQQQKKRKSSS